MTFSVSCGNNACVLDGDSLYFDYCSCCTSDIPTDAESYPDTDAESYENTDIAAFFTTYWSTIIAAH